MKEQITAEMIRDHKLYREWGLTDEEYQRMTDKILGRLPNYTETGLFSVMWSEHCSYKHSKALLKKFPTHGKHVLQGPGEGAGIVDIGDHLAVVFKAESHNHPSAVEPYEGAATGVGGIIRDIFSMGARPIALLDSLRFGELKDARTQYLLEEVVHGISGYGNCIGIPTVGGEISFDACYEGNPLVNAMCVGLIDHDRIQMGKAGGVGNVLLYVGAKTGRDGIHGATFASEEFDSEGEQQRSAVQVGDPFMEKQLLEACLEVIENLAEHIVGVQDMGAAGLVSSSAEMASKTGEGVILNLDLIPQRETQMTPYEIMLSESQERMLLCVKQGMEKAVVDVFKKYDLDAVVIGEVTGDGRYRLSFKEEIVADLPIDALTEQAPVYVGIEQPSDRSQRSNDEIVQTIHQYFQEHSPEEITARILAQPTIASKKSVFETYDHQVQTNTVVGPGSDAAVVRIKGTNKALAMTMDCNQRYVYLDPKTGGALAVTEAAANVVASGAKPLAITDCLNYGNPENPEIYWELSHSIDGMSEACRIFDTPVISGNVSLYNETNGTAIFPTPVIGMVGLIENLNDVTTIEWKNEGDMIYFLGKTEEDFAGSELQKLVEGQYSGSLPSIDFQQIKHRQDLLLQAIQEGLIASAHDCSEGGVLINLLESAFASNYGAVIDLPFSTPEVFSETPGRFVVTIKKENQSALESLFGEDALPIGTVTQKEKMELTTMDKNWVLEIGEMKKIWEESLACALKAKV